MLDKSKKSLLVIGGAGFIGVNAARHFCNHGWKVTILDNLSRRGAEYNLKWLQQEKPDIGFIKADIRADHAALRQAADAHDAVLHLAAQVAVTTSVTNPREDFNINALGTFNVLEAVRQSDRKPMVLYASTNKVYGGLEHFKVSEGEARYSFADGRGGVDEDTPLDFHSPYGCSKGAADQYVRDYARIYGLKTVVFRQSCIYGPHQMGIEDQGWVAWFMIAGLFSRPVTIYGNGKQVRDLLYIDDLVRAYDLAINKIEMVSGQIYNVGGGAGNTLSLREFLQLLKNQEGLELESNSADCRPGDQPIFVSDNAKMKQDLGWEPEVSVTAGIARLAAWLKENRAGLAQFYI